MSISKRDKDPEIPDDKETQKRYVKVWRIEASKEFILLSMILIALLSVSLYNPYQLLQIANQNLDNTERIINTSDIRFTNISAYINLQEAERKAMGIDVINILFLYNIAQDHKIDLLLNNSNIPYEQYDLVKHNSTHIYVEDGITTIMNNTGFIIPYPMNLTNLAQTKS